VTIACLCPHRTALETKRCVQSFDKQIRVVMVRHNSGNRPHPRDREVDLAYRNSHTVSRYERRQEPLV